MAPPEPLTEPSPLDPLPLRRAVVISCEHAGYEIPPELRQRIVIPARVLSSHRGYDSGSREIGIALGSHLRVSPFLASTTRLVVDLNRSESFSGVFSAYGRKLDQQEREAIFRRHYRPFRIQVLDAITQQLASRFDVLHISVHTFTPVLRGDRRTADIGLLFDPARPTEVRLAAAWAESLQRHSPLLQIKMNYPYLGSDDGHTTSLRTVFPDAQYAGIELEVNQKWVRGSARRFTELLMTLRQSLGFVRKRV